MKVQMSTEMLAEKGARRRLFIFFILFFSSERRSFEVINDGYNSTCNVLIAVLIYLKFC